MSISCHPNYVLVGVQWGLRTGLVSILVFFSILIGWKELGYHLIYLLWPNMVNKHSTTKWAERFFSASNPARKLDEKNHFAANINLGDIPTALLGHKSKLFQSAWFLRRVSTNIIKQSKQVLNQLPKSKEERHFLAIPRKIDSDVPALVVALCFYSSKCSDTN